MLNPIEKVIAFFGSHAIKLKQAAVEKFEQTSADFSNIVYSGSKRMDIVMLLFNAIAILSSHTAQIHGLEKSNRENKEFLIELEEKERKIDLALTLIPPLIINSIISRKLEKGEITTRYAEKALDKVVQDAGLPDAAIYSKVTHKANFLRNVSDICKFLKQKGNDYPLIQDFVVSIMSFTKKFMHDEFPAIYKNIEKKFREYNEYLKRYSDYKNKVTWGIVKKWDTLDRDYKFAGTNPTGDLLTNGSAIDEIEGMKNGILTASFIAYSILASNIIMPFFKNRWTNQEYDRGLKEMGETRESMRRKRRFEFNDNPVTEKSKDIFNVFEDNTNSNMNPMQASVISEAVKVNNPFNAFDKYTNLAFKNAGLKI